MHISGAAAVPVPAAGGEWLSRGLTLTASFGALLRLAFLGCLAGASPGGGCSGARPHGTTAAHAGMGMRWACHCTLTPAQLPGGPVRRSS